MSNELKCPICGEPTFVYMGNARKDRLCRNHGKMAKEGLIIQCPDCGKWNDKDTTCNCKQMKTDRSKNSTEVVCMVCGAASNGKPQCKECYYEMIDFKESLDRNLKSLTVETPSGSWGE